MEDHLDTILYLVIGIFYVIFSNSKKYVTEGMPEEGLPPSPGGPVWEGDWDEASDITVRNQEEVVQATPASFLRTQATDTPTSVKSEPASKTSSTKRILSRYTGWKKAMIMSEILRPHT